jgi:hypothetical protein
MHIAKILKGFWAGLFMEENMTVYHGTMHTHRHFIGGNGTHIGVGRASSQINLCSVYQSRSSFGKRMILGRNLAKCMDGAYGRPWRYTGGTNWQNIYVSNAQSLKQNRRYSCEAPIWRRGLIYIHTALWQATIFSTAQDRVA